MARLAGRAGFRALLLLGSLVFHMMPPITLVGPWYVMFRSIGWDNTHTALILAHVALQPADRRSR